MKLLPLTSILLMVIVFGFFACQSDSKAKKRALESLGDVSSQPANPTTAAGTSYHYVCPNKCVGGGGDGAGNCPICSSPLVHNGAFHNNDASGINPETGQEKPKINAAQPGTPATQGTAPPGSQEPPQNDKGVWHYVCPEGHAGGGGYSTETCGICSKNLVHNTEYHTTMAPPQ